MSAPEKTIDGTAWAAALTRARIRRAEQAKRIADAVKQHEAKKKNVR